MPIKAPERLLLVGGAHSGESLADAVARTGAHPSDALADWLLATDLDGYIRTSHRPIDDDAAVDVLRTPFTPVGRQRRRRARPDVQRRRRRHVPPRAPRARRGTLSVEEAIHALTAKQTAFFGIPDRGVVRPGAVADLVVFALDELEPGDEVARTDLPGDAWRYGRTPGGYRATIVAGAPPGSTAPPPVPARARCWRGADARSNGPQPATGANGSSR